jgi:dihydroorotate dehydrogenase
MFKLLRSFLFLLEPEDAHYFTLGLLKFALKIPGARWILNKGFVYPKAEPVEVNGLHFTNAIGLAAGFDKNAQYLEIWKTLGFGHVEIGTVTPKPQAGNEKPRLFRLPLDLALINRMGFNNDGVEKIATRLKNRPKGLIVGGNIGKNKVTPNEEAVNDYLICFDKLFDRVDYFTINVSSPNTPGLRELQSIENIKKITEAVFELQAQKVKEGHTAKPIFIKLAPDNVEEDMIAIAKWVNTTPLAGLVLSNTTIARENLKTSASFLKKAGSGGLSGAPVKTLADKALQIVSKHLNKDKTLIGVGGIMSAKDALDKKDAGASLVQIYTGFIYKGPRLVRDVLKRWK